MISKQIPRKGNLSMLFFFYAFLTFLFSSFCFFFKKKDAVAKTLEKYNSAGVAPSHRSTPISIFKFISTQDLPRFAKEDCELTHGHPVSVDVCVFVNMLCRYLVENNGDWDAALKYAVGFVKTEPVKLNVENIIKKRYSRSMISVGGFAPDVLFAALYWLDTEKTMKDALENSLQFAGNLILIQLNKCKEKKKKP